MLIAAVLAPLIRSAPSRTAVCEPSVPPGGHLPELVVERGDRHRRLGMVNDGQPDPLGPPERLLHRVDERHAQLRRDHLVAAVEDQTRQQGQLVGEFDQRRARRAALERGGLGLLIKLPDPVPDPEQFQVLRFDVATQRHGRYLRLGQRDGEHALAVIPGRCPGRLGQPDPEGQAVGPAGAVADLRDRPGQRNHIRRRLVGQRAAVDHRLGAVRRVRQAGQSGAVGQRVGEVRHGELLARFERRVADGGELTGVPADDLGVCGRVPAEPAVAVVQHPVLLDELYGGPGWRDMPLVGLGRGHAVQRRIVVEAADDELGMRAARPRQGPFNHHRWVHRLIAEVGQRCPVRGRGERVTSRGARRDALAGQVHCPHPEPVPVTEPQLRQRSRMGSELRWSS